jgi:lysyl-tRNA synthetase class 2
VGVGSSRGSPTPAPAIPWALRVELWDGALAAVRAWFRERGFREVSTATRVQAPAIEPFIEPIGAPPAFLATSPELAMKKLLAHGSGSIFQVAHVFREGEVGALHSEEFHLVEWYRVAPDSGETTGGDDLKMFAALQEDVEGLVGAVRDVAQGLGLLGEDGKTRAPLSWERVECLALMGESLGASDGEFDSLERVLGLLERVRAELPLALGSCEGREAQPESTNDGDRSLRLLRAWTELFSLWSDAYLDPWLAAEGRARGVHLVGFPAPLAALAQVRDGVALRCESHVDGIEIANGYLELRDAEEQRRRFERVNAMRLALGRPALPLDEEFLSMLARPGLPPCAGMALGLDRLLMLACGRGSLGEIALGFASDA